jgi:hypothetical protein
MTPPAKALILDLALWSALWCLSWGGFYALVDFGVNYLSSPFLTALYFFAACLASSAVFRDLLACRERDICRTAHLIFPAASVALGIGVYALLGTLRPAAALLSSAQPDMFFLSSDPWYFVPKAFDVLFQQVLVLALALLLSRGGLSLNRVSLICLGLFGGAHLFLVAKNGLILGGYFLVASMAAGWYFPRLMLLRPWGIACTYSLHVLFYVGTNALFLFCPWLLSA